MVSAKLLFLASVLAYAAAAPHFGLLSKVIKGDHGPKKGWNGDDCFKGYKKGSSYLVSLGVFGHGVGECAGNSGAILIDLGGGKYQGNWDESLNAVVSVSVSAGGIIDALIPGLGCLLANIVTAYTKIVVCVDTSPGWWGSLKGSKKPSVCECDYGKRWGWKSYDGKYANYKEVVDSYDVADAKVKVQTYIDKYCGDKKFTEIDVNVRVVLEAILNLSGYFDEISCNNGHWDQKHFISICVELGTVIGGLGSNFKHGFGVDIVADLLGFIYLGFGSQGYPDIRPYEKDITKRIELCSCYGWNDAIYFIDDDSKASDSCDSDSGSSSDADSGADSSASNEDCGDSESDASSEANSHSKSGGKHKGGKSSSEAESSAESSASSGADSGEETCSDASKETESKGKSGKHHKGKKGKHDDDDDDDDESCSDEDSGAESGSSAGSDAASESGSKSGSSSGSKAASEAESGAESNGKSGSSAGSKAASGAESGAESNGNSGSSAGSKAASEAGSGAESNGKSGSSAGSKAASGAESGAGSNGKSGSSAGSKAASEADSGAESSGKSGSSAGSKASSQAESASKSGSGAESSATSAAESFSKSGSAATAVGGIFGGGSDGDC